MGNTSIELRGLGKQYTLGQRSPYQSFREAVVSWPAALIGHSRTKREAASNSFWALRNATFDVASGESLGVIGHNGAGKSTMLKLLSRVTAPTEGRAVLRGRASALLEVGTGFHPELSGRENVYLNGAILGMSQADIRRRFDEIVEFAEVDRFIDTPVKRYSSGMQVRLAFAVAAFLEPDILIVDEVLAVGDAAFQRKCLGRLGHSSYDGRTVIFVSHNLPAVRSLCARSIVLERGEIVFDGPTEEAIRRYLDYAETTDFRWDLRKAERPRLEMRSMAKLCEAEISRANKELDSIPVASPILIRIHFDVISEIEDCVVVLNIYSLEDVLIAQSVSTVSYEPVACLPVGRYTVEVRCPSFPLQPGKYRLGFGIRSALSLEDQVNATGTIEITESMELESPWFGTTGGYLRLPVTWKAPILRADAAF